MSTSSSNLANLRELAQKILDEQTSLAANFAHLQKSVKLACPPGCGRCCFKPDIYCTPIELLPLALSLLDRGIAEDVYKKCMDHLDQRCIFLQIENAEEGKGFCQEYFFRPLVCRSFGVAGIHDKERKAKFSICKILKEQYSDSEKMVAAFEGDIPYIDFAKNKLAALDPRFLEEEHIINVSLKIMLEKVLILQSYEQP